MPVSAIVVLQEQALVDQTANALREAGHSVVAFTDPMTALDALEHWKGVELLVIGTNFGPGRLNGVALGRMARLKRPWVKTLFVGPGELRFHTEGVGDLMPSPATAPQIVDAAMRMRPAPVAAAA
jgi:CheY-like chemotaxis protein